MSYQEKRTFFSIVTGILILVAYITYVVQKYQAGNLLAEDVEFWAGVILVFIGIGIAVNIVGQIVFHVLLAIQIAIKKKIENNDASDQAIEKSINHEMITDEMDDLIELKAMRLGFVISGIGFVTGLFMLVFDYSVVMMLHVVFIAFSLGSVCEGFLQLYYYRKGVQ